MSDPLKPLRERIDALDAQILDLLNARARLAQEVGEVKKTNGAPVFRPEREAQVLRGLAERNPGPLPDPAIAAIYREIMSACRSLERPTTVAFLGPAASFSEQAAIRQFGQSIQPVPCASFDEVFREVEVGGADFGIVPVENSTEGAVNRSLDLLLSTPLKICGEVALKIEHYLLTRSGTMEGVTHICAHAQALAQCMNWLNAHYPALERIPVSSNSEAARRAAQQADLAAIAGEAAAERYGLKIVAAHIQDDVQNTTRFVVIGSIDTQPSGQDRTSLVLSVPNKAGAVHEMLAPLARHGVSMTRFESRPARTGVWTYYFYIDIEGHQTEPKVSAALNELKAQAGFFKILGSYPLA